MSSGEDFLREFTREMIAHPMERQEIIKNWSEKLEARTPASGNRTIPVSLGFDESRPTVAWLQLTEQFADLPRPEEYFIAPAANYDKETKRWEVTGYSFVHVGNLPSENIHLMRLRQVEEQYRQ